MATEESREAKPSRTAHAIHERERTDDVLTEENSNVDFDSLFLSDFVTAGLQKVGFEKPSPIQLKAIPLGRCGLDLIVQAKSGTGKTCVFTVIALESVDLSSSCTQVLVLAPTREIAVQIQETFRAIGCKMDGLCCHVFIGGTLFGPDRQKLKKCHVAIGTPGRIKQLIEYDVLKMGSIRLFVLDEADKLLDDSFQEQVNWVYNHLPDNKQMLALSATYPEYLAKHLTKYMREPTFVRLNPRDLALRGIKQLYVELPGHSLPNKAFEIKVARLLEILSQISFNQCLVFSNLHTRAQNLCDILCDRGWPSECISGNQEQAQRLVAMAKLKKFQCRILISTDLTARGIDAENVNLIINLDIPMDSKTYLHRIGRAGRFGTHGAAISLASAGKEMDLLRNIQRHCKVQMAELPDPAPSDLLKQDQHNGGKILAVNTKKLSDLQHYEDKENQQFAEEKGKGSIELKVSSSSIVKASKTVPQEMGDRTLGNGSSLTTNGTDVSEAVSQEVNDKTLGNNLSQKTGGEEEVLSEPYRECENLNGITEQKVGVIIDTHKSSSNESSEHSRHPYDVKEMAPWRDVLKEGTSDRVLPSNKPTTTDVGIQTLTESTISYQTSSPAQESTKDDSGSHMLPLGFEDTPKVMNLRLPSWSLCKPKSGCRDKWTWYDIKDNFDGFMRKKLVSESDQDAGRGNANDLKQTEQEDSTEHGNKDLSDQQQKSDTVCRSTPLTEVLLYKSLISESQTVSSQPFRVDTSPDANMHISECEKEEQKNSHNLLERVVTTDVDQIVKSEKDELALLETNKRQGDGLQRDSEVNTSSSINNKSEILPVVNSSENDSTGTTINSSVAGCGLNTLVNQSEDGKGSDLGNECSEVKNGKTKTDESGSSVKSKSCSDVKVKRKGNQRVKEHIFTQSTLGALMSRQEFNVALSGMQNGQTRVTSGVVDKDEEKNSSHQIGDIPLDSSPNKVQADVIQTRVSMEMETKQTDDRLTQQHNAKEIETGKENKDKFTLEVDEHDVLNVVEGRGMDANSHSESPKGHEVSKDPVWAIFRQYITKPDKCQKTKKQTADDNGWDSDEFSSSSCESYTSNSSSECTESNSAKESEDEDEEEEETVAEDSSEELDYNDKKAKSKAFKECFEVSDGIVLKTKSKAKVSHLEQEHISDPRAQEDNLASQEDLYHRQWTQYSSDKSSGLKGAQVDTGAKVEDGWGTGYAQQTNYSYGDWYNPYHASPSYTYDQSGNAYSWDPYSGYQGAQTSNYQNMGYNSYYGY